MPSVADVTGSEKSPPGGDTAPTTVTLPSRLGLPRQVTLHQHGLWVQGRGSRVQD